MNTTNTNETNKPVSSSEFVSELLVQSFAKQPERSTSRITVILHPNTRCIAFVLNDLMFNKEKYLFSRENRPQGAEKTLLEFLNSSVIGVEEAKSGKNTLNINIADGMKPREIVPVVLTAIKEWATGSGATTYQPEIHCDDRRWKTSPVALDEYNEIGGQKFAPGEVDIGVPYTPWID